MPIDLSKHKEAFLSEAAANIEASNQALVALEKKPNDQKSFHKVYRAVHSLKSLAATMNFQKMTTLCHSMEDLLNAIKQKKVKFEKSIDLLFHCFDQLHASLEAIEKNQDEMDTTLLLEKLTEIKTLDDTIQKTTTELKTTSTPSVDKIKSVEVKVEQLDALMNLAEELVINQMHFDLIRENVVQPELSLAVQSLGRLISELQYRIMQMRLVPIDYVFNRFIRTVRDLSKKQGKDINLEVTSSEIELDRILIDALGESIGHLIRNAVDHGIEKPEERKRHHKGKTGTIQLAAYRKKDSAVIEVSDDGRGLDFITIKNLAIKRGLLTEAAEEDAVKDVIFSEFSTSKDVSEFSGRGLGLSIVKQKMQSLGGDIHVDSIPGKKTTFFMEVPLTLAIIKTLFVKISGENYAIPIDTIKRLLVVNDVDVKGFLQDSAILYHEEEVPILFLAALFKKPCVLANKQPVVIVSNEHQKIGLAVDSFHSIQDIIVKPLTQPLKKSRYFSGVAVISSGQMVLILDVINLLKEYALPPNKAQEGAQHATDPSTE